MGKLVFEGISNARDLGGIKTKDGREIKEKSLIKSSTLFTATEKDLRRLKEDYNVSMIVDLRTEKERNAMPEPCFKDISTIWNPIYKWKLSESRCHRTLFYAVISNSPK